MITALLVVIVMLLAIIAAQARALTAHSARSHLLLQSLDARLSVAVDCVDRIEDGLRGRVEGRTVKGWARVIPEYGDLASRED